MKSTKESKKGQTNNELAPIVSMLEESDSFVFFKGTTCTNCKNKFPMPLTLQDNKVTCPECETEVSAI